MGNHAEMDTSTGGLDAAGGDIGEAQRIWEWFLKPNAPINIMQGIW